MIGREELPMIPPRSSIHAVADVRRHEPLASTQRGRQAAWGDSQPPAPVAPAVWLLVASAATGLVILWMAAAPRVFGAQATPDSSAYSAQEVANLEVARRFFEELDDIGNLAVAEE